MNDLIKAVINSGDYDLSDIILKIDTIWVEGRLTEDERNNLIELARTNSKPSISNIEQTVIDLTVRIQSIEDRISSLEGSPKDEYPLYEEGHIYKQGDKITFNNDKYVMVLPGETTASPDVYPNAWEKAH